MLKFQHFYLATGPKCGYFSIMKMNTLSWWRAVCLVSASSIPLFFGSCTSPAMKNMAPSYAAEGALTAGAASYIMPDEGTRSSDVAKARSSADDRPGLATGAGHERFSRVADARFFRINSSPDALAKFHYNDETGAKAMAALHGKATKKSGWMEVAGDRVKVALVPLYGNSPYPRYEAGGESIVIAESGDLYAIHLKNLTKRRLELVVSVDGLNVLNGQPAGTSQRGYILEPKQDLEIEGFRVNNTKVKTFRFGAVGDSVAAGKGAARNVGVVGLAVFEEDVARAKAEVRQEQNKRLDSDAFPVSQR